MVFSRLHSTTLAGYLSLGFGALRALGFDNTRSDNLAVYYGQNSYGATHTSDTANWQQPLSFYCQDDSIDVFPIAFLNVFFDTGGLPSLNMANTCNFDDDPVFAGTELPNCQFLAADIQACQAMGKIVTISLGGATGAASFTSDTQAEQFADTIWNLFLGGSSSTRPFGNAVLDGVDLDIEGGGSTGFAAFVTQIRSHAAGATKPYYVTGAPQCPFPDAYLGSVINAVGFDAIYVQFYNNYCSVASFSNPNDWDFSTWDNWAKNTSPNKNVKVYIGAPASSTAAGSGYVDAATLASIALQTRSQYSSFGGVMLWDASQAYANNRFDAAIKNAIRTSGGSTNPPTTVIPTTTNKPTTTVPTTAAPPTTTVGTGSCSAIAAWVSTIAYVGGSQVTYNGHLWTAKWWTEADTPGGAAGVWTDDGACSSNAKVKVKSTSEAAMTASASASASASGPASKSASSPAVKSNAAPKVSVVATSVTPKATTNTKPSGVSSPKNSRFFKF